MEMEALILMTEKRGVRFQLQMISVKMLLLLKKVCPRPQKALKKVTFPHPLVLNMP
jgi:hypothetical protein